MPKKKTQEVEYQEGGSRTTNNYIVSYTEVEGLIDTINSAIEHDKEMVLTQQIEREGKAPYLVKHKIVPETGEHGDYIRIVRTVVNLKPLDTKTHVVTLKDGSKTRVKGKGKTSSKQQKTDIDDLKQQLASIAKALESL
jgi:hypothetical protein